MASILFFIGCGGGAGANPQPNPIATAQGKKPTIFIQSRTYEKFHNMSKERAIWNGLSPALLKNDQYMRCDMTAEAIVSLTNFGFEVVHSPENADYTFDTTLSSCTFMLRNHNGFDGNRMELPLKERALYKDFTKWVNEEDKDDLPKSAKKIHELISKNDYLGFKMFYDEKYLLNYGYDMSNIEKWKAAATFDSELLKVKDLIICPSKYADISEKDLKILKAYDKENKKYSENIDVEKSHMRGSANAIYSTTNLAVASGHNSFGYAGIAIVIGNAIFGGSGKTYVPEPNIVNKYTIINNKNGKTWSMVKHSQFKDFNMQTEVFGKILANVVRWNDLKTKQ